MSHVKCRDTPAVLKPRPAVSCGYAKIERLALEFRLLPTGRVNSSRRAESQIAGSGLFVGHSETILPTGAPNLASKFPENGTLQELRERLSGTLFPGTYLRSSVSK